MSPDGSTKPLPEEKLLKLIRERNPRTPMAALAPAAQAAGAARPGLSVGGRAMGWPVRWSLLASGALAVVLVAELGYFAMQLSRPAPAIVVPLIPPVSADPVGPPAAPVGVPSLAQSAAPTLFESPLTAAQQEVRGTSIRRATSEVAKLLASRLTLMGVMAGNPSQAIIEDSQTKKSYFVSPGQPVVDGAVVDQVLDNRVILDLEGEKIELTL